MTMSENPLLQIQPDGSIRIIDDDIAWLWAMVAQAVLLAELVDVQALAYERSLEEMITEWGRGPTQPYDLNL